MEYTNKNGDDETWDTEDVRVTIMTILFYSEQRSTSFWQALGFISAAQQFVQDHSLSELAYAFLCFRS